jgi:hypothetical protein
MRKPACCSVACTRDAATKLPVHSRLGSRAVEGMTFETARVPRESETLLGSKPQLTQAMRDVSAVVDVAQSVTTATSSIECWVLR